MHRNGLQVSTNRASCESTSSQLDCPGPPEGRKNLLAEERTLFVFIAYPGVQLTSHVLLTFGCSYLNADCFISNRNSYPCLFCFPMENVHLLTLHFSIQLISQPSFRIFLFPPSFFQCRQEGSRVSSTLVLSEIGLWCLFVAASLLDLRLFFKAYKYLIELAESVKLQMILLKDRTFQETG